jgi:signal peptidase
MRRLRDSLSWLALLLALGGWSVHLRPPTLGGDTSYVFVTGHSMLPTYRPGDLVPVQRKARYEPGDVVAFRVDDSPAVVIHRVRAVRPDGTYVVRGDNQSADDPWYPDVDRVLGTPLARIPRVGRALAALGHPLALGSSIGLAAGLAAARVRTPNRCQ